MTRVSTQGTAYLFVSYAVEDRPAATRIVDGLKALGWDVWWDREIVAGNTFDEHIASRLAHASAVIVLWSRHSVASEWVREEASEAKRRDILIPVFIERVDPPFGFTLRHGVDLTSWTGTSGSLEFAALATAVRGIVQPAEQPAPASIDRIQGQRAPRRGWRVAPARLALGLLALLGIAAGLWYWDAYYRLQVAHFANVTKRDGLPHGIGPLDSGTVARRNASLALVRHGRRNPIDEVRIVNASGDTPPLGSYTPIPSFAQLNPLSSTATDFNDILAAEFVNVTRVSFSRDSNGRVLEQRGLTATGRSVYTLRYASPDIGEYKRQGFASPIRESGIVYVRFTRTSSGPNAGLDEKVVFLDAAQKPQPDEQGEFGYRVVFDDQGRMREIIALGSDLKDAPNSHGVLRITHEHDARGDVLLASNLDASGELVNGPLGNASVRMRYDESGNMTRAAFYDPGRALVTIRNVGAAGTTFVYDNTGRITSQTLFGPDERPIIGPNGFATVTWEWLSPTRSVVRFSGPDGRPLPVRGSAFEVITTWDAQGLPVETEYRNDKGGPTRSDEGCSILVLGRDAQGNIADLRCLNEDRAPTISTEGFSSRHTVFDERALPLTTTYVDRAGKPGLQGELYTSIRLEYTEAGKVSRIAFLDGQNRARKTREGYASFTRAYDARGNMTGEAYFDEGGRPTIIVGGYASRAWEYDARNRERRVSFLGTDGQPVAHDDGYAAIQYNIDERGFVSGWTYLDTRNRPVRSIDGVARVRVKRNEQGQTLEITYADEHGRAVVNTRSGIGQRRFTYTSRGKVLERSDFDVHGRPAMNAYGYAILRLSYDEHGREVGRELVDVTGRPMRFKVVVDRVARESVAADAGFRSADVILSYDGEEVTTSDDFRNRLELFKGDRSREVRIERAGQVIGLELPPGRMTGLTLEERVYPGRRD